MKKIILMIELAFSIALNAQNITTNGTILLDDATSRTRVVVDAFLNSSNKVHELIEEISPSSGGDFTTNNIVLVNTIETVSPKTSLEPATNYTDLATNSLAKSLAPTITNTYTKAETDARIAELAPRTSLAPATNYADEVTGVLSNALLTGEMQVWSAFSANISQHANYADVAGALSDGTRQRSGAQIFAQIDSAATPEGVTNIVTNTVTKSYVEGLGIESGVSAETATNIADTASAAAVANADTTYRRTIGITNLNQSVQYVNITDTAPTTLAISMPTDGVTKDWMVYVVSVTNVTLSLPAATWWMADVAYTNDVPPATPTALWFSQVTDGIFILGRQELTPATITTEE